MLKSLSSLLFFIISAAFFVPQINGSGRDCFVGMKTNVGGRYPANENFDLEKTNCTKCMKTALYGKREGKNVFKAELRCPDSDFRCPEKKACEDVTSGGLKGKACCCGGNFCYAKEEAERFLRQNTGNRVLLEGFVLPLLLPLFIYWKA